MNVVFDLGGVVVNWRPDALVRSVVQDSKSQRLMRTAIIDHPDWLELDRGTLAASEAINRAAIRTRLSRDAVQSLFDAVPPSLTLIPETVELMRSLKDARHRLFILSNMHQASIDYLENAYDFWDLVDGAVISCRINSIKPEARIFEHLLAEQKLAAAETIFIDDLEANVAAARSLGIRAIRFDHPAQCERDLAKFGCVGG